MVNTITLPAESNSLVIETSADGWAKCFLLERERIYLGADDLTIILTRLRDGVCQQNAFSKEAIGELEGFPVVWLLSLSEMHHVLYAAVSGEDFLLFWQNARQSPPTIAGTMRLTPKHQRQWQQQLDTLLHDPLPPVNGHRLSSPDAERASHAEAVK